MNQEQMHGKMDQLTGKIKETWGRLTDDDVALYNGKKDQFFGKLQEMYGLSKEDAIKRMAELETSASSSSHKAA